ncbi:MAG: hypothetical protein WAV05_14555 [Anaerolineales bacterium]
MKEYMICLAITWMEGMNTMPSTMSNISAPVTAHTSLCKTKLFLLELDALDDFALCHGAVLIIK